MLKKRKMHPINEGGDQSQQQRRGGLFSSLFVEMSKELKSSNSSWEAIGARALKLASQLQQVAATMGSFVDALQTVSDAANSVNGVNRDIGASLTRFCLRQRTVEIALRQWAKALQGQCAGELERRAGEWRHSVADLERRHHRNCKRLKGASNGKANKMKQQFEAESRSIYVELLHSQRAQYTEFIVGALLPVINAQLALLEEGTHIRPVRDSIETAVNGTDTNTLVQALLEDISCSDRSGMTAKKTENEQLTWDKRVGLGMAQSRAKSASQARLFEGDEDEYMLYGSTSLTAHRNSMPPPSASSQQFWSVSCPSSAVATISSSSSSALRSPPNGGMLLNEHQQQQNHHQKRAQTFSAGSGGGGGHAVEANNVDTVWQQYGVNPRNVPSQQQYHHHYHHQRMPIPSPFVAVPSTIVPAPPPPTTQSPAESPQHQNQWQKPPLPPPITAANKTAQKQQKVGTTTHSSATSSISGTSICSLNDANGTSTAVLAHHYCTMNNPNSSTAAECLKPSEICRNHNHISGERDETGSQCALIAETLQQIDRLGLELDNYCEGLEELDSGSSGTSGRPHQQVQQVQPPDMFDHCPPPTSPPSSAAAVRFRPYALSIPSPPHYNHNQQLKQQQQQQQQQFSQPSAADAVPPPLPPQRRNSAISAATPTAPSIAELRSVGAAFAAPYNNNNNNHIGRRQPAQPPAPAGLLQQQLSFGPTATFSNNNKFNNVPPSPSPMPQQSNNGMPPMTTKR